MSNDVEVTGFVDFHIDLDDLTFFEHQILVSLIATDRYPKISLAQQVRIISELLLKTDLRRFDLQTLVGLLRQK